MNWFVLTLVATICLSLFNIFSKHLLSDKKTDPVAFGAFLQLGVAIITIPFVLAYGWRWDLSLESLTLTAAVALLYTIASAAYYTALAHLEISLVLIVISLDSVFSQITGNIFLGEPITLNKAIAGVLIFSAVVLAVLTPKDHSGKDNINKPSKINKYYLLVLLNVVIYSLTIIIDKILVGSYFNPLSYQFVNFALPGIMILLLFPKSRRTIPDLLKRNNKWPLTFLTVVMLFLTYFSVFSAYKIGGEVGRVTPILGSQVVIVVIIGALYLGERKNFLRKLIAGSLVVIGLFLMGI